MVGLHGKAGSDALASQVRSVVLDYLGFWILDFGFWMLDFGYSSDTLASKDVINNHAPKS